MDTLQQIQKGANIMAKGIAKPFGAHAPEGYIDHDDTDLVVCPNCGYELTEQEAKDAVIDCAPIYIEDVIRMDEPTTFHAICPSCTLDFDLTATMRVTYSTAKAGE